MYILLITAFAMGLVGSFHCVGMCGPLALSLPISNDSFWPKVSGALIYNLGRVVTYSLFGVIFGAIGKSVAFFGYQQWLSVLLGVLIIGFIIIPKRFTFFKKQNFILKSLKKLRAGIGHLFKSRNYSSLFFIGLLNGLLPCGLVYMAAAAAVSTGNILNSIVFMAAFGLGTLPMMWGVAFFGNYINIGIRQKIRKAYPYMMLLMACLLILRGMGLGVPYLSPKLNVETKVVQGCCAKQNSN